MGRGKPMTNMSPENRLEVCEIKGIHDDIVEAVHNKLPNPKRLSDLADLFKLFADGARISILWALSESEMCVCDLCALLRMRQPTISHQLKNLKLSRLVKTRRDGKVIYYSLDDEHIRMLLDLGMRHLQER
jgi:ArsR family transcriptional regulator, lead/cadmium/zinc/bismuth-responsive transcriptional repressor